MPDAKPVLSDAEVICEFMEPKPKDGSGLVAITPESRWWRYCYELEGGLSRSFLCAVDLTLDRLHEVEARLTNEQIRKYTEALLNSVDGYGEGSSRLIHASAEQKIVALRPTVIVALASVLRDGGGTAKSLSLCKATTKRGRPCQRMAVALSRFCRQHTN